MPRKTTTAFQKFLIKQGACAEAREFVAKRGGDFARAWRANKDTSWREWLLGEIGPPHGGSLIGCPGCKFDEKPLRARVAFLFAQARKRRWIK